MNKKQVAIIGAGVSGIIKSIYLKEKGYQVTLYEKGAKIAGSTSTVFHEGKPYDLSTKLIPAISLNGYELQSDFLELANSVKFEMEKYPDAIFYDFWKNKRLKIPEPLQQYSIFKVLSDFVKGYEFLSEVQECFDVQEIQEKGLCLPGENIEEWGKRTGMEAFATFTAYVSDLFFMGPAHTLPVSYSMASRVYYLTPYLHKFLSKEPFATIIKWHPQWNKNKDLLKFIHRPYNGSYLYFKGGYEPFFQRLVEKHQLNIRLNANISNIRSDNGNVLFDVNGATTISDSLIFCCPLHHAAQAVNDTKLSELMQEGKPERQTRVWTIDVKSWDSKKFPEPVLLGDGANPLRMGHPEMKVKSNVYGIEKFYPAPIALAAVYLNPRNTEDEYLATLKNTLPEMKTNLDHIISHEDFEYSNPSSISASKEGWYSKMKNLQGQNGLYFSGQMFCGSGVVTIAAYSRKFIDKYF